MEGKVSTLFCGGLQHADRHADRPHTIAATISIETGRPIDYHDLGMRVYLEDGSWGAGGGGERDAVVVRVVQVTGTGTQKGAEIRRRWSDWPAIGLNHLCISTSFSSLIFTYEDISLWLDHSIIPT